MSLKNKISLIISILFTTIYTLASVVIYVLFAEFRQDEFENRLREKAISTIRLLVEVEQVDQELLKIIDQNSINKLYDEKTLIFDAQHHLIYSSLDDTKIKWTVNDLQYLKKHKKFFKKDQEQEVYGFFYDTREKDYYALVSAKDSFGKRKLEYLRYILIATYLFFSALAWIFTYKTVKKLLKPIDVFHGKIKGINEQNLDTRIEVNQNKDEIDLLAKEFNQMLERIDESYKRQQEFTYNASHELRTPVARLLAQLENKMRDLDEGAEKKFFQQITHDVNQLKELTNSLLILSQDRKSQFSETCRIDEIIFESLEILTRYYEDLKLDLDFRKISVLEIPGNKSLLIIAFQNLIKNAYLYSAHKSVKVVLYSNQTHLTIEIINDGKTLSENDQSKLFTPFMRGDNAREHTGLGIGLRIVQRILTQHQAQINYQITPDKRNMFKVVFKL